MAVNPPTRGQRDWDDEMNNILQSLDSGVQAAASKADVAASDAAYARNRADEVHTAVLGGTDAAVSGFINDDTSATKVALNNTYGPRALTPQVRPVVRNRDKLARFATALATKATPVVTVVGNSISWGVGSDGSGSTTSGFYEPYRQNAWPVLLRKLLARQGGYLPSENFVGLTGVFGYATLAGGAGGSNSVGPFGYVDNGGGVSLPSTTATAEVPAVKVGKFTDLDVFYWGTGAGVGGGKAPTVLIDDVEVYTGGAVSTGRLTKITVTGLSDAAHKITIKGAGTNECFVNGIVTRRGRGVVVNRIATPGSQATNVSNASGGFTVVQQERNIDGAILAGYSDLVCIQFTANEVYQQTPLASFQSAVEGIITRAVAAGACVLLLADPDIGDATAATLAIKGSQYRAVLQSISDAQAHVAYADQNAVFGDRATAEALGLFPSATVHPALEGHRRMADFVLRDVLPGPAVSDTATPGPDPVTAAAAASADTLSTPSGQWVIPPNMVVAGSSGALGASNCRAYPVVIRKTTRIDALSVSVTAAGTAGALIRLGVYADDGTGYPGALVVDAGTVPGDAIANPVATFAAVTLTPGVYWFCGTLQGTLTTQPTVITPSSPTPPIPIRVGTSPIAGTAFGFIANSVAGALPATFTATLSTTGAVPRVLYRIA